MKKDEKVEITIGKDIYSELKKNSRVVWTVAVVAVVAIGAILFLSLNIYKDSVNKIYTINNKGDLIPLSLVSDRNDKIKVIQSNVEYFIKQYYDLDQYSIADKKERTLWLIGEQPTKLLKDKDNKGYYSSFLSINGLVQKSEIIPDSWQISDIDGSPNVNVSVLVQRVNGLNKDFYKADLQIRLTKVNINYPYNPFGYLITNLVESLSKVAPPTENEIMKQDTIKAQQANPPIK